MRSKPLYILIILALMLPIFISCDSSKNTKKEKPNILLITIDTLRRDHLGAYGYARNTSPFIDQLAKKGTKFNHVITPIPNTASSHISILTSLHPLTHGVKSNANPLTDKVQTISEVLKKDGYYTIGTVSVTFLSKLYNFSQGFDSFDDQWNPKVKFNETFQRIAEETNKALYKQLQEYKEKNTGKPLFLWVHYYDPHFIYHNRDDINFEKKPEKWADDKHVLWYDKEIRYTDQHIEKLYNRLQEMGLTKKMVTCITADHGEQLHDHGLTNSHADIYSENTFVPLIFHGYRIPENKVIDNYVSTLDIAPTLLARNNAMFDYPVEGIDLLQYGLKPEKYPKRKLLVIGNAKYTRSLQIVDYPTAYIQNFDFHYKHWHHSFKASTIPEANFKPVKKKWLRQEKKNITSVVMPYKSEKGLNYYVLRCPIKSNNGLSLAVKMLPYSMTREITIPKNEKFIEVIYPVTIRDRIFFHLKPAAGTEIDTENLTYAFINRKEFPQNTNMQTMQNQVFEKLVTLRKDNRLNEIYDLTSDVAMVKNLQENKKLTAKMIQYRKLIYAAYRYFTEKRNKLLRGTMSKENYSEKEKEMLKSLGYL
jgi:arylsulfatase A-like enzyme